MLLHILKGMDSKNKPLSYVIFGNKYQSKIYRSQNFISLHMPRENNLRGGLKKGKDRADVAREMNRRW